MGKNKLKKFTDINNFPNVIQPDYKSDIEDFKYKGRWNTGFFKNNNPLVLEIGCGKGEYAVNLAKNYPGKNFIGIDIKGDRIWHGAKKSLDTGLNNIAFLRIQAEKIEFFFDKNEASEIWLTFPDPQPRKTRIKKRLTSPQFLKRYQKILLPNSPVHLKTDNKNLFEYTREIIAQYNHKMYNNIEDLYNYTEDNIDPPVKNIQTYYEKSFIREGSKIYYLKFSLNTDNSLS